MGVIGGLPAERAFVEIGAILWNADREKEDGKRNGQRHSRHGDPFRRGWRFHFKHALLARQAGLLSASQTTSKADERTKASASARLSACAFLLFLPLYFLSLFMSSIVTSRMPTSTRRRYASSMRSASMAALPVKPPAADLLGFGFGALRADNKASGEHDESGKEIGKKEFDGAHYHSLRQRFTMWGMTPCWRSNSCIASDLLSPQM